MSLSLYMPEIIAFARSVNAKAAYCFVVDGDGGSGGSPILLGMPAPAEYRARCEELLAMLERSAQLLRADLERHAPKVAIVP